MASRYSVEAVFKAVDQMSRPLKKMTTQNRRFTRAISRDFAKAQRQVDNFGRNLSRNVGRFASRAVAGGFLAIGAGVAIATREFIEFDQAITGAASRFKDLELGTEKTAIAIAELKRTARETAKVTQFTAVEAAAGLNFFAKAGFTSAEAMAALKTQVDLATVAELDLATTSDITSDLLGALGLNAADSATKIDNLGKLSNSLGVAANMANVTLTDIFETLKIAGPIATAAGEDMDTLIAITASLGSAGIKGSMGATAIKNAYLNLATNAPAVQKALEKIGLAQSDFVDQETGTLDMVKAMKLLGDATKGMGKVEQLAVFEQIFGKRAVAGAVNISKSLSEIELITQALAADKNIADIADQIRTGLGMQVKILKSGLLELGFQFVEAFEKDGRGALSNLITAVQNFDMKPVIAGVKTAIRFIGILIKIIKPLLPFILGLIAAYKAYKAVLIVAAVAQKLFDITIKASTIGMIITAVGIFIGLIVLLAQNWNKVKTVMQSVWDFFKKIAQSIGEFFGKVGEFLGVGGEMAPAGKAGGLGIGGALETRGGAEAPISPSERGAFIREERISRGEVTIRDEAGRAEITKSPSGPGFTLALERTGTF